MGSTQSITVERPAVIDLTEDFDEPAEAMDGVEVPEVVQERPTVSGRGAQRPPRFERNILDISDDEESLFVPAAAEVIDLSQEDDYPPHEPANTDSPEVEFVSARPLPPHLRQQHRDRERAASTESWHNANRQPTPHHRYQIHHSMSQIFNTLRQAEHTEGLMQHIQTVDRELERLQHRAPGAMTLPLPQLNIDLDFTTAAFDLGHEREREATGPPAYEAPSPAPAGFTRTPAEDDVLVCPNCGDQLCEGKTDQKKQLWAIKKCGHVSEAVLLRDVKTNMACRSTAATATNIEAGRAKSERRAPS